MITKVVIFAFIVGALTGPVIMAAISWAKKSQIVMNWWKWMLAGFWYIFLMFSILLSFTMMGEGEKSAGWKILLFLGIIIFILGVGLYRIIKASPKSNTD